MWDGFCRSLRGEAPLSVMADDTCASFARRQKGEQAVWGGGCCFCLFLSIVWTFSRRLTTTVLGRCAPMNFSCSFSNIEIWSSQLPIMLQTIDQIYIICTTFAFFPHWWGIHRHVLDGCSAAVGCPSGLLAELLITGPLNSFGAGGVIHCWANNWTDWVKGILQTCSFIVSLLFAIMLTLFEL